MTLEDWEKALKIHNKQIEIALIDLKYETNPAIIKQASMDIEYGKVMRKTIKRIINKLKKNAPICNSEGNKTIPGHVG